MKNLSGKDYNRETLCFKSETSHGSSSSSSGNASSQAVNKSIQAVAQRYCIDCKGSFDELSKITQVCDLANIIVLIVLVIHLVASERLVKSMFLHNSEDEVFYYSINIVSLSLFFAESACIA